MTFKTTVQARTQSATAIPVTEEILAALGPAKRPLLRVTINGYSYTARVGIMNGERLIPASAEVRKRAGIAAGDEITVDVVTPLGAVPPCDRGAPELVVNADEGTATVAYYASSSRVNWETTRPEDLGAEEVVVLRFDGVHSLMFGAPNDEALHGHPLADAGLDAYGAYRVDNSSWIRRLERMNRVHARHSQQRFLRLQHFILTFHDSTLECVARAAPEVSVVSGKTPRQAVMEASPSSD